MGHWTKEHFCIQFVKKLLIWEVKIPPCMRPTLHKYKKRELSHPRASCLRIDKRTRPRRFQAVVKSWEQQILQGNDLWIHYMTFVIRIVTSGKRFSFVRSVSGRFSEGVKALKKLWERGGACSGTWLRDRRRGHNYRRWSSGSPSINRRFFDRMGEGLSCSLWI